MNRQQWVARVAAAAAGTLSASTLDEAVPGVVWDELPEAERKRLEWAMEEVQRRLYRMGQSEGSYGSG